MLIITRKKDEKVIIAGEIEITILEVGRNRVRFGINAPKHVSIHTRLKASPAVNPPLVMEAQAGQEAELQTSFPSVVGFSKRA